MPPKKEEPVKKKAEPPKELCGCGVNTYRPPPKKKGKKGGVIIIEHAPDCTYQRATCNRYPHLPKCASCEIGCQYCAGINPWCPHCMERKCKFQYHRDLLAIGIKKPEIAPPEPVEPVVEKPKAGAKPSAKKAPPSA